VDAHVARLARTWNLEFLPWDSVAAFAAHDPLEKWHPWTRNVIHLAVNTRRVPDDPPRSLRDLADPKWAARGRIGLSNPASSGTAYTIVPALVTAHGWDFLEALLRKGMKGNAARESRPSDLKPWDPSGAYRRSVLRLVDRKTIRPHFHLKVCVSQWSGC